jgi:L-threonylcarbamoyladenylate synthase
MPIINSQTAIEKLNTGDVVAIPTETVYGLAAKISDAKAIEKIFKTKNRPFFDPLIVHVSNTEQWKDLVYVPENPQTKQLLKKLMDAFWPGPLTLVLPKSAKVSSMITSGLESVGLRMPKHTIAREIIEKTGPLAAPSANRFGKTSPTNALSVQTELPDTAVVDGGPCEVGIESTVIGFNDAFSEILIYRPGAITAEMLSAFAPVKKMESPAAPGQLKHHYMPDKPFVLVKKKSLGLIDYAYLNQFMNDKKPHLGWMQISDDPTIAARNFYSELRRQSEREHVDLILLNINNWPESDMWSALLDRATKAASIVI